MRLLAKCWLIVKQIADFSFYKEDLIACSIRSVHNYIRPFCLTQTVSPLPTGYTPWITVWQSHLSRITSIWIRNCLRFAATIELYILILFLPKFDAVSCLISVRGPLTIIVLLLVDRKPLFQWLDLIDKFRTVYICICKDTTQKKWFGARMVLSIRWSIMIIRRRFGYDM